MIIKGLLSHFCGFNPFLPDKIDQVLIHIHSFFFKIDVLAVSILITFKVYIMSNLTVLYKNFIANSEAFASEPELVLNDVVDMYLKDIHTSDTMGSMNYTRYPMINPSVSHLSSTELQEYKANGLVLEAPEYAGKIWVETIDGYSMLLDTLTQDEIGYIRQGTIVVRLLGEDGEFFIQRLDGVFESTVQHKWLPIIVQRLNDLWY